MSTSLWPERNLVTECITISAPIDSGVCTRGVAKVLSTPTPIPSFLAALINVVKSATSKPGLVGDSSQTRAAPVIASMTDCVSSTSTKRTSKRPLS